MNNFLFKEKDVWKTVENCRQDKHQKPILFCKTCLSVVVLLEHGQSNTIGQVFRFSLYYLDALSLRVYVVHLYISVIFLLLFILDNVSKTLIKRGTGHHF